MELILISDNKVKIMLTRQDMEHYELCNEEIDYDCTETRRAFWQILDEVKHKTGFDAAKEKVFIQLYPSREGGCEMYVTKLDILPATTVACSGKVPDVRVGKTCCYLFQTLDSLLRVCAVLYHRGYRDESSAYAMDDGTYALLICEYGKGSGFFYGEPDTYAFIEEFGKKVRGREKVVCINEHGTCLAKTDAVKELGELA